MKAELKMDACILCGRKVQPAENWMRSDHLWGGFASFHWKCFREYLRAGCERQVETVMWRARTNAEQDNSPNN